MNLNWLKEDLSSRGWELAKTSREDLLERLVNAISSTNNISMTNYTVSTTTKNSLWEVLVQNNGHVGFHPNNQHINPCVHAQSTKFHFNASFELPMCSLACNFFDRIGLNRVIKRTLIENQF